MEGKLLLSATERLLSATESTSSSGTCGSKHIRPPWPTTDLCDPLEYPALSALHSIPQARTDLDYDGTRFAAKDVLDKVDFVSSVSGFHGSTSGDAPLSNCSSTNRFWRGHCYRRNSNSGLLGSKILAATRHNDSQKTWEIAMCLYGVVSLSYDIVLVDLN